MHPSNPVRRSGRNSALKALIGFVLACFATLALAEVAGTVTHLSGTLAAKKADGTSKLLSVKSEVHEGDTLSTQDGTYARVKFVDGAEVVLRPNSQLAINTYRYKEAEPAADSSAMSLLKGGLRSVTGLLGKRNPEKVNVNTVTATIGIRGTHFGLLLCQADCGNIPTITGHPPENGLHMDVADGTIHVSNAGGQQLIHAGQFGFVRNNATPPVIVPPGQGIQVTMPPSISQNNAAGQSVGKSREAAECAVQ